METQLPLVVKARIRPKIVWGGCWTTWRFGRTPVLSTPHASGEPVAPIEFPTSVIVDDWSDGRPDLILRYQYDARGNITSFETDEGADGLVEERVVLTRDDNGAIVRSRRQAFFPFARTDEQVFWFNPYGFLVATDDFYKKRTFATNHVSPVVVSADRRAVKVGALSFTLDNAGEVVEARNIQLGLTQTFAVDTQLVTSREQTTDRTRETTVDRNNRLVAETVTWEGGRHGRRTTYKYEGLETEIDESELPAGSCVVRWRVVRNARDEILSVTRDNGCDGFLDKAVQSTVDTDGRLTAARYHDRSVALSYEGTLVRSATFTHGPTFNETIRYKYDSGGRLVEQQRSNETLRWSYDTHGRVISASMESRQATTPGARTIRYEYTAPPLNLTDAPKCGGDRSVAGLVMTSELELPTLDARAPALFQDNMPLNLPSVAPTLPRPRFAPGPLRELETAIANALAREQWTAVRYELVDQGAFRDGGKLAGPVVQRGVHECPGSAPYFARDKHGAYFELQIEKRCKTRSTSPEVDPLTCQWGTPPPEYDVVLHVPRKTIASRPRKLVVELPNCVNYTRRPHKVP